MTIDDIKSLIATGEGFTLEFKKSVSSSIGREICAFANSQGGKILVGVDDNGKITGVQNINRAISEIQTIARNMDPALLLDFEKVVNVLLVKVQSSKKKPHSVNGKFYIREAANSQQLSRNEIRDFFYNEGLIFYDDQIIENYNFESDFSYTVFNQFKKICGFPDFLEQDILLRNLGLLKNNKITRTGMLLFTENIVPYQISASISCSLFFGHSKVKILDSKHYEADLYSNYHNAMNYLLSHINTEFVITKDHRKEIPEIPEDALREAVLNAIAHRDYQSAANIQVCIFKDRIEISNPGGLPGGMKIEDFGKKSIPRNPLLFSMLHRMNLVEKIGSGYLRIREMMKRAKLQQPEYEIEKDFFSIRFLRPKFDTIKQKNMDAATQKTTRKTTRKILELLKDNPRLSRSGIAELIDGITEDGIKYHLNKLKKEGKIKRIGAAKGGHWEVLE